MNLFAPRFVCSAVGGCLDRYPSVILLPFFYLPLHGIVDKSMSS